MNPNEKSKMDSGATIDDSVTADTDNVRIADAEGSTGRIVMTGGTITEVQFLSITA